MKLALNALAKAGCGLLLLGLLLFVPAWTLHYPNAWLLLGLLFVPMLLLGAVLLIKAPQLLRLRLNSKEQDPKQKQVVALSGLQFVACFLIAGFDFRLDWSRIPLWLELGASGLFLIGYGLYARVMQENAYLSRTVELQQDQRLIDTGLYALVRHPMYFATVVMFLAMPLVLGSLPALLVMLPYPWLLKRRIVNEERVLQAGLPGYCDYQKRVKYRLIPFLW